MSLEDTNPLETDDGQYPLRPKTTGFPGGPPPEGAEGEGDTTAADERLYLAVQIGEEPPLERSFQPSEVLVGRRPGNDISIDGEGLKVVSGYHMRFAFEGGRWCVEDKGSTNGTFLNGVRVSSLQAVRNGDVVELGRPRKVGSYRSVKLCVALPSRPAIDVTGTSDALGQIADPEHTIVSVPASPAVKPEEDVADVTRSTEDLLHTIVSGSPEPDPEPLEATIAGSTAAATPAPAAVSTPVPASKPDDLRALIEKVQAKSRRLGEVSYRLDAHVADLASALVERHAALGLADVPGGAAVVDRIDEQERRSERERHLEAELPLAKASLAEELAPLETEEQEKKEEAEALAERLEAAAARREETAGAFDELLGGLTTTLRESLAPVVDSIVHDGLPEPATGSADEPVWRHWANALARGAEDISAREDDLEAARALADEAAAEAASVETDSTAATTAWEEVRARLEERRTAGEQSFAEMDAELTEARTRLESLKEEVASAAKELVLGLLAGPQDPPGQLAALAGMDEAQSFAREAEQLRKELADLEQSGG